MEYWDDKGLSRIASKIGVPLFMDYLTSSSNRISFARVCLELNVDSELPQHFFVRCEEEVVEIKVEYQGIPTSANTVKSLAIIARIVCQLMWRNWSKYKRKQTINLMMNGRL